MGDEFVKVAVVQSLRVLLVLLSEELLVLLVWADQSVAWVLVDGRNDGGILAVEVRTQLLKYVSVLGDGIIEVRLIIRN